AGWLSEVAPQDGGSGSRRGRPARRYTVRAGAGMLIGVDAGEHTLAARAVDLRGRELSAARQRVRAVSEDAEIEAGETGADRERNLDTAETRLEQVRSLIDRVRREAGSQNARRLLTVVGVPAPV